MASTAQVSRLPANRPVAAYAVHLLFDGALPRLDGQRLHVALRERFPRVERLGPLQFVHVPEGVHHGNLVLCPGAVVTEAAQGPDADVLARAAAQTWDWPVAKAVAARCKEALVVSDLMGLAVDRATRMALFHGLLESVLEQTSPLAIHWLSSARMVDPANYLRCRRERSGEEFVRAVTNVRFFRVVGGEEDEVLMDTLGLAAFGLPDLQYRFVGREPNDVARKLYDHARDLFERGDVLHEGETLDGAQPGTRWECKRAEALVEPQRTVLELSGVDGQQAMTPEEREAELDALQRKIAESLSALPGSSGTTALVAPQAAAPVAVPPLLGTTRRPSLGAELLVLGALALVAAFVLGGGHRWAALIALGLVLLARLRAPKESPREPPA